MSDTLSVDVVGPGHWTYTAAAMARHLALVLEHGCTRPDEILVGVHENAKRFLAIALEASGDDLPLNPFVSFANYQIATETLETIHPISESLDEMNQRLRGFAALLQRLAAPGPLAAEESEVASDAQRFFEQLAEDGYGENYGDSMGDPLFTGSLI